MKNIVAGFNSATTNTRIKKIQLILSLLKDALDGKVTGDVPVSSCLRERKKIIVQIDLKTKFKFQFLG
jgi:hypothetical protein